MNPLIYLLVGALPLLRALPDDLEADRRQQQKRSADFLPFRMSEQVKRVLQELKNQAVRLREGGANPVEEPQAAEVLESGSRERIPGADEEAPEASGGVRGDAPGNSPSPSAAPQEEEEEGKLRNATALEDSSDTPDSEVVLEVAGAKSSGEAAAALPPPEEESEEKGVDPMSHDKLIEEAASEISKSLSGEGATEGNGSKDCGDDAPEGKKVHGDAPSQDAAGNVSRIGAYDSESRGPVAHEGRTQGTSSREQSPAKLEKASLFNRDLGLPQVQGRQSVETVVEDLLSLLAEEMPQMLPHSAEEHRRSANLGTASSSLKRKLENAVQIKKNFLRGLRINQKSPLNLLVNGASSQKNLFNVFANAYAGKKSVKKKATNKVLVSKSSEKKMLTKLLKTVVKKVKKPQALILKGTKELLEKKLAKRVVSKKKNLLQVPMFKINKVNSVL